MPDPSWYRYMWLDLHAMCTEMLTDRQQLAAIKYFTAPITGSKGKQERQNAFFDALRTFPQIEIIFGRFQNDPKHCDRCGHSNFHPQEKKTDVNIATNLICDALADKYDTALLITADSDIVPAIEAVKKLRPEKRIVVAFPPGRYSKELEKIADNSIKIWEARLRQNRLPEIIKRDGLPDVTCPHNYSGEPGCTGEAKLD
jgi:uncharacterized LabA/DUF88 family protein